ncbi:leucine-rich repeat domain-containing protein [Dietzia cinnamea]|uniref:leucine-rich repeat domain-containing protein n=1 Tax=Dietzia cinnamea TaxID=321318 RepID=UPI0021A6703C|nr:leucine-rich repeat domain-containing protein [Dietzia cinnamea]MCT2057845.1 leucine-rich repeat domain-containing protein [Dietzia cinnamea]MCT2120919.1 leucine-rich repeat domain-containing protein [Dietzia cinnamea]MCT2139506.1 leucine-rich repeat domain-containing protein [Dietzia cinnamea]MCT2144571.1 leucine-rich repeat domain-containing protein [Dietzia cinnamea]MCT2304576.1 leucine-rich repeat domain-containing protein [Dietzia cinnamea]
MPSALPATAAATRRHLSLVLALLLSFATLGVLAAAPARADDWTGVVDGLVYSVDTGAPAEGAAVISGASGATEVTIPSTVTIDGIDYAVTAVGRGAFAAAGLESVTLPDTLEAIGDEAFVSNQLATVTLPRHLTHLGEYAFKNNTLTSLTLPDSREGVELGTARIDDIVQTPGCGVELTLVIRTSAEEGPGRWASIGPGDFAEVRPGGTIRRAGIISPDCEQAANSKTTALSAGRQHEIIIPIALDDSAQQAMLRPDGTAGWMFDLPPLPKVTATTSPSASPPTSSPATAPDEPSVETSVNTAAA